MLRVRDFFSFLFLKKIMERAVFLLVAIVFLVDLGYATAEGEEISFTYPFGGDLAISSQLEIYDNHYEETISQKVVDNFFLHDPRVIAIVLRPWNDYLKVKNAYVDLDLKFNENINSNFIEHFKFQFYYYYQ